MVSFAEHPPVLRCFGDECRSTQARRRHAFARALRARADLVVDLRGLTFADASLMLDVAMLARRMRQHGGQVRVRGAQPQILKLIEVVGLDRQPGVLVESHAAA